MTPNKKRDELAKEYADDWWPGNITRWQIAARGFRKGYDKAMEIKQVEVDELESNIRLLTKLDKQTTIRIKEPANAFYQQYNKDLREENQALKADLESAVEALQWIGNKSHDLHESAKTNQERHEIGVLRGVRARQTLSKLKTKLGGE